VAENKYWYGVASDADGSHLVAAAYGGRIYVSSNGGASWVETAPTGLAENKNWRSVASDADGSHLIAAVSGGGLYVAHDDLTPPIISSSSSIGSTITWETDEASSSQLAYGLTALLGTTTPITDTSPLVTSHSVSLSDLVPCTLYYYQPVSQDSAANQSIGDSSTFITSGCTTGVGSSVSSYVLSSITNSIGGGLTLASSRSNLNLTLPPSVKSSLPDNTVIDYQAKEINLVSVLQAYSSPTLPATAPSGTSNQIISSVFDLKAYTDIGTTISSFDQPITVTINYSPSQLDNVNPSTLSLYRHDGTTWHQLNSSHDQVNRTLTATTTSFSLFAIFGQTYQGTNTSVSSSPATPPQCTDPSPASIPHLFEIRTTPTTAKLFFTPISNTSTFYLSFSENQHAQEHGEQVILNRLGVQSHTLYHLKPNTTYYFKVRGQNGCTPGDWSNILSAKTTSSSNHSKSFYPSYPAKSFFTRLSTNLSSMIQTLNSKPTPTPTPTPTSSSLPPQPSLSPQSTSTPLPSNPTSSPKPPISTPTPTPQQSCFKFLWWCF